MAGGGTVPRTSHAAHARRSRRARRRSCPGKRTHRPPRSGQRVGRALEWLLEWLKRRECAGPCGCEGHSGRRSASRRDARPRELRRAPLPCASRAQEGFFGSARCDDAAAARFGGSSVRCSEVHETCRRGVIRMTALNQINDHTPRSRNTSRMASIGKQFVRTAQSVSRVEFAVPTNRATPQATRPVGSHRSAQHGPPLPAPSVRRSGRVARPVLPSRPAASGSGPSVQPESRGETRNSDIRVKPYQ